MGVNCRGYFTYLTFVWPLAGVCMCIYTRPARQEQPAPVTHRGQTGDRHRTDTGHRDHALCLYSLYVDFHTYCKRILSLISRYMYYFEIFSVFCLGWRYKYSAIRHFILYGRVNIYIVYFFSHIFVRAIFIISG